MTLRSGWEGIEQYKKVRRTSMVVSHLEVTHQSTTGSGRHIEDFYVGWIIGKDLLGCWCKIREVWMEKGCLLAEGQG